MSSRSRSFKVILSSGFNIAFSRKPFLAFGAWLESRNGRCARGQVVKESNTVSSKSYVIAEIGNLTDDLEKLFTHLRELCLFKLLRGLEREFNERIVVLGIGSVGGQPEIGLETGELRRLGFGVALHTFS
jgi:hypothetical protein